MDDILCKELRMDDSLYTKLMVSHSLRVDTVSCTEGRADSANVRHKSSNES